MFSNNEEINSAVILAAGKGSRLYPVTKQLPKCLVQIGGKPILHHMIDCLIENGFEELIIVTGYFSDCIDEYVSSQSFDLKIKTVRNHFYATTNNLYSLWCAAPFIQSSFVLIESDLVIDQRILGEFKYPDRIALDEYCSTQHNGTTASVCDGGFVKQLHLDKCKCPKTTHYKTVNISSFSKHSWDQLKQTVDEYVRSNKTNVFYELAIQELVEKKKMRLKMVDFRGTLWEEIDTIKDLDRAEKTFEISHSIKS